MARTVTLLPYFKVPSLQKQAVIYRRPIAIHAALSFSFRPPGAGIGPRFRTPCHILANCLTFPEF
jgi:hypothetical protein